MKICVSVQIYMDLALTIIFLNVNFIMVIHSFIIRYGFITNIQDSRKLIIPL